MEWVVGILAWIILALIVGAIASRKGFSFWVYFFHGIFPSFITALITLSIFNKLSKQQASLQTDGITTSGTDATIEDELDRAGENPTAVLQNDRKTAMDSLERLHDLKVKGIISEGDYEEKKKKLLGEI